MTKVKMALAVALVCTGWSYAYGDTAPSPGANGNSAPPASAAAPAGGAPPQSMVGGPQNRTVTFSCSTGDTYIDGVAYLTANYWPMVHTKGNGDGTWAYLTWAYGLNTVYGRSMLSVALTALATGNKVWINCDGGNNVTGIWIEGYK